MDDGLKFLISLLAIVNPFAAVPSFIAITASDTPEQRRRIAAQTALAALVIMCGAFFAGGGMLRFFGISVASFRIAGGLLILTMAMAMFQARTSGAKQTPEERREAEGREQVAVIPLAIPILAGPGTISLLILAADGTHGFDARLWVLGAIGIVALSIWVVLRAAGAIARVLGTTGLNILTRMMGIVLAALAIEFIAGGLAERFPAWTR